MGWLEAGVANGCFLVHAPRPLVEASIEMAEQLRIAHDLLTRIGSRRSPSGPAASCRRLARPHLPSLGTVSTHQLRRRFRTVDGLSPAPMRGNGSD